MRTTRKLFADATASIEDTHSIAVEGQAPALTPDIATMLLAALRQGMRHLDAIAGAIEANLAAGRP